MTLTLDCISHSSAQTQRLGMRLGELLRGGELILLDGQLALITAYAPTAGFSVGAAMGRNKVIYGLSDFAVVVSSDFQTGGTWAGAVQALKAGWCPLFVRNGENVPKGNKELLKLGATSLPEFQLVLYHIEGQRSITLICIDWIIPMK